MNNLKIFKNNKINEKTYYTKLENGLDVYICKKDGYNKKIGIFGTKYGSIINDFIDITTEKRIQVPDGVAHFLEHKLFEQEGANALDLFSKEGIKSNAYTTFDHTAYYFETANKFKKGLDILIKLVKTPYFTDENVEKEKGIIAQEISMYDDDPFFCGYFNLLTNLYLENNVRIDIAGTKETIQNINKDILYKCYNTFYNLNNMFLIVVGDVNVDNTLDLIKRSLLKYNKDKIHKDVKTYNKKEPEYINKKSSEKKLNVYMPQVFMGYKLKPIKGIEIIKKEIIAQFVSDMYFSNSSEFYKKQYECGNLSDSIELHYEGSDTFSHIIINTCSKKPQNIINIVKEYIEIIKNKDIDFELFNITKKKKIGQAIMKSENMKHSYRSIIENLLNKSKVYSDIDFIFDIKEEDIKKFLLELDVDKFSSSIIK